MCGFAGLYYKGSQLPSSSSSAGTGIVQALPRMAAIIQHRGPDDEGFFFANTREPDEAFVGKRSLGGNLLPQSGDWTLGLAHRRMSILDLSPASSQPMLTQDASLTIVYNGEIFNYAELRAELAELGHSFRSTGDTEVLLEAYREWGFDCLPRLNGMFAFVLYDKRHQLLFCARDRFGIKPFYYYDDNQLFACASEIKSFFEHPAIPKKPDDQSIHDYLLFGIQDHSERTFFKDIVQLPPAHYMVKELRSQKTLIEKWWDIDLKSATENESSLSFQDQAERFYELLKDSSILRLRSDVPIAACVSGGLDSSAVSLLAHSAEVNPTDQHAAPTGKLSAFSMRFLDKHCDDGLYIDAVHQRLQVPAHMIYPSGDDFFNELEALTWHMDEPFRSSNQYSQWCLMKAIHAEGFKVALSGQGSDEFLGGYRGYRSVLIASLLKEFKFAEAGSEIFSLFGSQLGMNPLMMAGRILFGFLPKQITSALPYLERNLGLRLRMKSFDFLNPNFLTKFPDRYSQSLSDRHGDWSHFKQKLHHDLFAFSLPQLLHYEDRTGMAFTVEARHPFLDHRLVEFVFGLPLTSFINNGQQKHILRESMQGILPSEVYHRRDKKGFITPENEWLGQHNKAIRSLFSEAGCKSRDYLDTDQILKSFDATLAEKDFSRHTRLWRPLNLEIWLRRFF